MKFNSTSIDVSGKFHMPHLCKALHYLEPLFEKKVDDMHVDFEHLDISGSRNSILIMSYLMFSKYLRTIPGKLFDFLSSNKIILASDFDLQMQITHLYENFPEHDFDSFDNLIRITDSPTKQDRKNVFYLSNFFLECHDIKGMSLLTHQNNINSFFCLMGKKRLHRDKLYDRLLENKLDADNKIVYHRYGDQKPFKDVFRDLEEFNPLHDGWDWPDGAISEPYDRYCFELAVETRSDFIFATEKTVKPLLTGMPFIVLSAPYHLRYLRSLGFKTYGQFIDESYDEEEDLEKRIDLIMREIVRLHDGKRFHSIYHESRDIAYHNRKILCNIPLYNINSFVDGLKAIIEDL